ncbi:25787_t:CDS:1, partial [Gigaspora margarita]
MNPILGGRRMIHKAPSEDNSCKSASKDKFYKNTSGTIIKNYYITT